MKNKNKWNKKYRVINDPTLAFNFYLYYFSKYSFDITDFDVVLRGIYNIKFVKLFVRRKKYPKSLL